MKSVYRAACGLLVILAAPALADDARFVSVDGSATISVSPDRAVLSMAVEARDKDLQQARAEVVRVTRAFLEFADDRDIDGDDIQTSGLSIRPEYRWNQDENRQVLLGYFVERRIVVNLKDLDKLGAVMEGAVDVGVNQVQPPAFRHSKEKDLRRRALARATEDARANALQIAQTLGAELGDVRRVTSNDISPPPAPMLRVAMMSEAAADGADTYSTGQISIEASVSAEFDLLPGKR